MPPATVDEVASRLAAFWSSQGCQQLASYDAPVGAAALIPTTYLRLLGAQPVRSCGLQWLRWPGRGRYGRDPLLVSRELCFQALLKPGDGAVDDLLIKCLKAAGFELDLRDLKLQSEPRWLAEVGLGGASWRATLDGIEIARLTFFLRLGDQALVPSTFEVVFGVQRLVLLQRSSSAVGDEGTLEDLPSEGLSVRFEQELSTQALESASVEALRARIESASSEAARAVEADLLLPAYELVLDCLHHLECLDARGDLGASERERWQAECRTIALRCAEGVESRRQSEGLSDSRSLLEPVTEGSPGAVLPGLLERAGDPAQTGAALAASPAAEQAATDSDDPGSDPEVGDLEDPVE